MLALVLDITAQLLWSSITGKQLAAKKKRSEGGGDEENEGDDPGPAVRVIGQVRPGPWAVVVALGVLAYRSEYESKPSVPLAELQFADARSLRTLERRVEQLQQDMEMLRSEMDLLQQQERDRQ